MPLIISILNFTLSFFLVVEVREEDAEDAGVVAVVQEEGEDLDNVLYLSLFWNANRIFADMKYAFECSKNKSKIPDLENYQVFFFCELKYYRLYFHKFLLAR